MNLAPGKLYCKNQFDHADKPLEIYEMTTRKFSSFDHLSVQESEEEICKPAWVYDFWYYNKPDFVILFYTGEVKAESNVCFHKFLFGEKELWIREQDLEILMQIDKKLCKTK